MKEKRLINIVSEVYKRSAVFNGEFIAVEKTQKRYCGRHTPARLYTIKYSITKTA